MGHMTPMRFSGNRRLLVILASVVGLMVGMAYASVPLYKLFCQVTGYGGTTQVSNDAATHVVAGFDCLIVVRTSETPTLYGFYGSGGGT